MTMRMMAARPQSSSRSHSCTQQTRSGGSLMRTVFSIRAKTEYGAIVKVVGNHEALGNWDVTKGVELQTNNDQYPTWTSPTTSLFLRGGELPEYKYVILDKAGQVLRWEEGENRRCSLSEYRRPDIHSFNRDVPRDDGWFKHSMPLSPSQELGEGRKASIQKEVEERILDMQLDWFDKMHKQLKPELYKMAEQQETFKSELEGLRAAVDKLATSVKESDDREECHLQCRQKAKHDTKSEPEGSYAMGGGMFSEKVLLLKFDHFQANSATMKRTIKALELQLNSLTELDLADRLSAIEKGQKSSGNEITAIRRELQDSDQGSMQNCVNYISALHQQSKKTQSSIEAAEEQISELRQQSKKTQSSIEAAEEQISAIQKKTSSDKEEGQRDLMQKIDVTQAKLRDCITQEVAAIEEKLTINSELCSRVAQDVGASHTDIRTLRNELLDMQDAYAGCPSKSDMEGLQQSMEARTKDTQREIYALRNELNDIREQSTEQQAALDHPMIPRLPEGPGVLQEKAQECSRTSKAAEKAQECSSSKQESVQPSDSSDASCRSKAAEKAQECSNSKQESVQPSDSSDILETNVSDADCGFEKIESGTTQGENVQSKSVNGVTRLSASCEDKIVEETTIPEVEERLETKEKSLPQEPPQRVAVLSEKSRKQPAGESEACPVSKPMPLPPQPFFNTPQHPQDERSRTVTLDLEKDILIALQSGYTSEEKRKLVKLKLPLKAHPDKGGTDEACEWLDGWKEKHYQWFLSR